MSELTKILETYQLDEDGSEFDSLDDLSIDEETLDDDLQDIIVDIYESASDEEKAQIDEMLSSDEGYKQLLEMIAEADKECDDDETGESPDKDKKKKKTKKIDTKDGDVDDSEDDGNKEDE